MLRCGFAFLAAVCALRAQQPSDAAARGRALFTKNCSFCHGTNAMGGAEGPNLILSSVVRHDKSGDQIGPVIREGRPAKGMPPFSLADSQIADIVAYLHQRLAETDVRSPNRPKDYSLKLLLTGDAGEGKKFFEARCVTCHSATGDLKGVAGRFEPAALQASFLYPDGIAKQVRVKENGRGYRGELIYADPFTLEMRDQDGEYHSWDPRNVEASIFNPVAAHLELLPSYSEADMHNVFAYLETLR